GRGALGEEAAIEKAPRPRDGPPRALAVAANLKGDLVPAARPLALPGAPQHLTLRLERAMHPAEHFLERGGKKLLALVKREHDERPGGGGGGVRPVGPIPAWDAARPV